MAQLGEASAGLGPWEDLALRGSVLLSGAWPPSLSSTYNLLFSDTSALEIAISWLPCVSPAPPRPPGCGVSPAGGICCSSGSRLETGCGRTPRRVAGLGTAVSSHLALQLCVSPPRWCPSSSRPCWVPSECLPLPVAAPWVHVCHSLLSWPCTSLGSVYPIMCQFNNSSKFSIHQSGFNLCSSQWFC